MVAQGSEKPQPKKTKLYEQAEVVARVGNEVILAAEVSMGLDKLRERAIAQIQESSGGRLPPEQVEALDQQLQAAMRKRLKQKIETLLICQHAAKNIPAEGLPKIKEAIGREYEKREIPRLMKELKVPSRRDLEDKLQQEGMTLESHKHTFIEQALAAEWLRQQIKSDEEVSYEQMTTYYKSHPTEFERPARVRWEQLTVRGSKYPGPKAAWEAMAKMGNAVMDGKPLAQVAKENSDGPTAAQGGQRSWTTKGSLTSEVLEKALFGLPVGQLSPILTDDRWLHIVRVVEREEAARTSFADAQVDIREKIRKQRESDARETFLARIRQQIPVWTAFKDDDEKPGTLAKMIQ